MPARDSGRMPDDRKTLAALFLVLQGGLALLAAVGLAVFARFTNSSGAMAVPQLLAFGGPVASLCLAVGITRGWRVARIAAVIWQAFTLLGTLFTLVLGGTLKLTILLAGIALPLAILFLVVRPNGSGFQLHRGLLAGLLLLTGVIHLGLVPDHLIEQPRLGPWFALDGAAFVILSIASLRSNWWPRAVAAGLLVLTIAAYVGIVANGREAVDDLGVATKLIELVALGLILWPRRIRFGWRAVAATSTLLVAILTSGAVTWAATLRPESAGMAHGKVILRAGPPTDEQRAAAARLLEDTRAGIERYTDVHVALADGYRPSQPAGGATAHYNNPAYEKDGRVVDANHPEALVYANTPRGPLLLGAMYMLPLNTQPPDIGGSLTEWHTHANVCFLLPFGIDGLQSPYGTCSVGALNAPLPPMLHVWTVANPGGPFGDLSPAFETRLARGE
jgi:hypothetical protein